MFPESLVRLKQENTRLRQRLAAIQQLGLRGSALKAFEAHYLGRLRLDQHGRVSSIQGQDGQDYAAEEWLQRARQQQEGPELYALLTLNDGESEISQPQVGVEQLGKLSAAQLAAIARGDLVITVAVLEA